MNKVFKSVWSEALGAWVAASELCRGRGKGGGKVARSAAAAALILAAGSVMASTATGNGATTVGPNDNALGDGSYANGAAGADSTAIGHNVKTNGGNAFSIGSIITNGAASSIVMGNGGTNAVTMDAPSSNTVFFAPNGGSVALGANSVANEDNTASVGSAGNERRVTNVAPGQGGTDAANMNQVNALRNEVGQNMTALQRSAFGGVASAMAMPSLSPREPGKTVVAVGVANYKGYGAVGAGATYRSRDGAWLVNGALSVTPHGDTGARAQVGYEF
ncbi:trimeric autotransporter adhesin, BpaC [Caballeronia udeis]|uniref:Trimeric autotransporter adhesin, BpaC n=1 Tax=Caballeronia udeis TaxID=1232866 RepID=A0A158HG70_9BURK|nr:ESPR-type extended signal peptide-containing protein [Caballeronia udeis]SAL43043.1 trimeric autotransporter adhesin, BpaC [Caballeronia udeis]